MGNAQQPLEMGACNSAPLQSASSLRGGGESGQTGSLLQTTSSGPAGVLIGALSASGNLAKRLSHDALALKDIKSVYTLEKVRQQQRGARASAP